MITLVDYGLGNVKAFANIYKRLNIPLAIARSQEDLRQAKKIILPGVGSFDWAMDRLSRSGMRPILDELAAAGSVYILGICVGMQMMARRSEEGNSPGLNWIPGEVHRFESARLTLKTRLPHMGWNDVYPREFESLFRGMEGGSQFYFLHSYYFSQDSETDVLAKADYGGSFTAVVNRGRIFGVQFHPEKSHKWGIQLLKNFSDL